MARLDRAEVPAVERDDRSVGAAEQKVGVAPDEIRDPRPILSCGLLDLQVVETAEKARLDLRPEPTSDQVRRLRDNERRSESLTPACIGVRRPGRL